MMHIMRSPNRMLLRSHEIDRLSYLQDTVFDSVDLEAGSCLGEAVRPARRFRKGKREDRGVRLLVHVCEVRRVTHGSYP
jgi:hypothetical protein